MGSDSRPNRSLRIAIIGAGPGGLCTAIKLKQAGFDDFVLLEKADGVGGTWFHNRYPGCACDLPSAIYSFSFEIKKDWSRPYATQPEILTYMEELAAKHELLPHCRFGAEVRAAKWDEGRATWSLELTSGESVEAEVVVSALGMFNDLAMPEIEGLDSFEGTSFHSARWDWDHDLSGETIGVIGSAASAVQFVPEIVEKAGQVHLFQRSANWVLPKEDTPYEDEVVEFLKSDPNAALDMRSQIFEEVDSGMTFAIPEMLEEASATGLGALEVVEDPDIRAKLTPQHPFGCKRPLYSNYYYPMFNRSDLELVTDPIARITPKGVVTEDGKDTAVDTLIFATGFAATRYISVIDVEGRNGRNINDAWSDGAAAYLGITTSGFPNLFMIYGPNTNNGSILTMIEHQADYAVRQISRLSKERLAWIDVREDVMDRFNEEVQEAIAGVGPWNAGCTNYYRTPSGRIVTQWPFSMTEFRERTEKPDADLYESAPLRSDG